jgi:cytochrome P450
MSLLVGAVTYAVTAIAIHVVLTSIKAPRLPASIPWAGGGKHWLSRWYAHLSELFRGKELLAEGYFKASQARGYVNRHLADHPQYSKQGQAYAAPNFNFVPDVILPPKYMRWLNDQPEDVLSAREGQLYFLSKYTFSHDRLHQDTLDATITRTAQILRLQTLQGQVWDELTTALRDEWGDDNGQWREVNLYETMWTMVARTANRAFVGKPLCRNKDFLNAVKAYVNSFATQGVLIRFLCPDLLKPLLGRVLALPVHWRFDRLLKNHLTPLAERLAAGEKMPGEDDETFAKWLSETAQSHQNPAEREPVAVAGAMASAEFAPLHTSTFAIVNALLDILSSKSARGSMAAIREEAKENLRGDDPSAWSKAAHLRLELADSAIRESQRLSRTSGKALLRRVVAKNGVDLPDGTHIPKGVYVGFSMEGAHQDSDYYDQPDEFLPFRHCTAAAGQFGQREFTAFSDSAGTGISKKFVSTGPEYLSFGHGKHGCPGRFFVAQFLTVLLGMIARDYDVQPLKAKPEGHRVSDHYKPADNVMLKIRRVY